MRHDGVEPAHAGHQLHVVAGSDGSGLAADQARVKRPGPNDGRELTAARDVHFTGARRTAVEVGSTDAERTASAERHERCSPGLDFTVAGKLPWKNAGCIPRAL